MKMLRSWDPCERSLVVVIKDMSTHSSEPYYSVLDVADARPSICHLRKQLKRVEITVAQYHSQEEVTLQGSSLILPTGNCGAVTSSLVSGKLFSEMAYRIQIQELKEEVEGWELAKAKFLNQHSLL